MTRDDSSLYIPAQSAYSREVLIELVSLHARILRRMPWLQALLAFGVGLFVLRHVPFSAFALWCAISIGVEFLRARYAAGVMRRSAEIDPGRVHTAFVLWALAAGSAVGVGAALCFSSLPIFGQAFLGVILFAMPAAGVAVSQSSRYIVAAYSLSMLIPAAASWMFLHTDQALAVGVLTLLYCGLIILVAVEGDQLLLRSVIIRHERDRLVRDLELRNADVRAAMERAEQAAQSRARVLATASHDLRQPLHALSIYSAVLAANPEPAQLREVGANIDQIVRSLGSLLHGLLDLSRLTAGHFVPERKRIALDLVVAAICAEYQRTAAEKNLILRTDTEPVHLLGDAVAIGRIVRNLVDNAVKYTETGAVTVAVGVEGEGDAAVALVSVSDSGVGIPAEEQVRIFEEFYQLDNPGRDRSKGVGLGLAIVKRLCELIDAEVNVDSVAGQGTNFRVRMRGVLAESARAAPLQELNNWPELRGRSVYLVDDEVDILRSTQQLLTIWGMHVCSADSVAAAEQLFASGGAPELFITDLRLRGEENGAELAARLQHKYPRLPTLIITGEISAAASRQVEQLGAVLLYKPLTAESLRRAISRAIVPAPDTMGSSRAANLGVQP
jgi:signal transduction histidine kinase/ActR/RegA family two-component response regulator